ncbi:MAG: SEC-C metal-binding domain-containing protein, partial [Isosphaeraceae bacterium]
DGRPILVGTTSIEKSEELSEFLTRFGIEHQVLNAKYHEREAEIVAQAGRRAAVTIATNMAGRGTDIILGGNPEFMAWADLKRETDEDGRLKYETRLDVPKDIWQKAVEKYEPEMRIEGREVAAAGGLHIIGTERHESRRIDNQLRGRSGRQGDPGSSRFFLALEDDLMRKFAGEWVSNVLTRLGMQEGEAIESKMVSRRIEGAQKKVEERNFDIRKNLLEYDEVMDEQRKRVYSFRQSLLEGEPPKDKLMDMLDSQIADAVKRFLDEDYGTSTFAEWVTQRLGIDVTARDLRGAAFEDAADIVRSKAERQLYDNIREAVEENLPADSEPSEWTWMVLVNWANNRFELNLKEKDLKKFFVQTTDEFELGRPDLEEFLHEQALASIEKFDLSPAKEFLEPDWGRHSLAGWAHHKFGLVLDAESWAGLDRPEVIRQLQALARKHYALKEAELPVRIALARYMADRSQQHHSPPRYDREGLSAWASDRFHMILDVDEIRHMLRPEIEALLIEQAHKHYQGGELADQLDRLLEAAYPLAHGSHRDKTAAAAEPDHLRDLAAWGARELGVETTVDELASLSPKDARARFVNALDAKHRPEMREMEKVVMLQILDASWMEHLRAMDHLRSSIGLQGYAQIDPKVEYKREGMRIFAEMWNGIADRATDLIFRVEHFDPEFLSYLGSRWKLERAQTIHQAADSQLAAAAATGGIRQAQDAAIAGSQQSTEKKKEPLRNVGKKVGRNDPCPCGSGKKFKACCMRKQAGANPF